MTGRDCIIGSVAYIAGLIFGYACGKGRKGAKDGIAEEAEKEI